MNATLRLDGSTLLQHAQDIVCRRVGGESILVPIRQNVGNLDYVYTLSEVAADVWTLLDGTRSVDAIIDTICERYEVDHTTAAEDVTTLITDLAEAALVSQVDSGK